MDDGNSGPSGGERLGGIFLLLCGLCMAFVGGGCTIFWLGGLTTPSDWKDAFSTWEGQLGLFLLLLSVFALALGAFGIVIGMRLLRGRRARVESDEGSGEA